MPEKKPMNYGDMVVGERYGSLSYEVTVEKLSAFRSATGDPDSTLIMLSSKDYSHLPRTVYDPPRWVNAGYEVWYSGSPKLGDVLTTAGSLFDKYERRGRNFITVETITTNQDGMRLSRALTTLMLGGFDVAR